MTRDARLNILKVVINLLKADLRQSRSHAADRHCIGRESSASELIPTCTDMMLRNRKSRGVYDFLAARRLDLHARVLVPYPNVPSPSRVPSK
jgi:hypothetical protein